MATICSFGCCCICEDSVIHGSSCDEQEQTPRKRYVTGLKVEFKGPVLTKMKMSLPRMKRNVYRAYFSQTQKMIRMHCEDEKGAVWLEHANGY